MSSQISTNNYALQQLIYGETTVNIDENGLWNATALVQAYNKKHNKDKRLNNWLRTDYTKELISDLQSLLVEESATDSQSQFQSEVLNIVQGGTPEQQGTWIHPELVLPLAHWLSPRFYLWCNRQIKQLFTKQQEQYSKNLQESQNQLLLLKPLEPLLYQPTLEKQVQKMLEKTFGGSHYRLNSGIIDILSDKFIVEAKNAPNWKDCIGQLHSYRHELVERGDFNNRICVGYFFDPDNWLTDTRKKMILDHFHSLDFEVALNYR